MQHFITVKNLIPLDCRQKIIQKTTQHQLKTCETFIQKYSNNQCDPIDFGARYRIYLQLIYVSTMSRIKLKNSSWNSQVNQVSRYNIIFLANNRCFFKLQIQHIILCSLYCHNSRFHSVIPLNSAGATCKIFIGPTIIKTYKVK